MNGVDTFHAAYVNIFWAFREIAFTWVPATVLAVTGTAPGTQSALTLVPQPVSPSDIANYVTQGIDPTTLSQWYFQWGEFVAFSLVISVMMATLIIYCGTRILEVRKHERERIMAMAHTVAAGDVSKTQLRWNHILEEINKDDDQRWRVAILEADIMLNELLDLLGYRGETMADKMKQVDRADFRTIDLAWEAHKVRNAVAHQGSMHILNHREAQRVIGLYDQVFREFKLIE